MASTFLTILRSSDDGSFEGKLPKSLAISILACTIHSYITVGLRIISRLYIKVPLLADDFLAVAALLPLLGMQISAGVQLTNGMGMPMELVPNADTFEKAIIPAQIFYVLTLVFTKYSMLYFFKRIFPQQILATLINVLLATISVYSLAMIVALAVECRVDSSLWYSAGSAGVCVNRGVIFKLFASLNVATNIATLALPIRYMAGLKMSLSRKLHVIAIFTFAAAICAVTLLRITLPMQTPAADTTLAGGEGMLWSQIEIATAILCACSPTFRPLCSIGQATGKKVASFVCRPFARLERERGSTPILRTLTQRKEKAEIWTSIESTGSSDSAAEGAPLSSRSWDVSHNQLEKGEIRVKSTMDQTWEKQL